ncbi:hypothetical protein GH733_018240 [Mirounga leonina]|nr:hypothetical protein GH733_018240 [Mirounga leonina]
MQQWVGRRVGRGQSPWSLGRELHFPEGSAISPFALGRKGCSGTLMPSGKWSPRQRDAKTTGSCSSRPSAQAHLPAAVAGFLLCGSRWAFVGGRSSCSRILPTVGRSVRPPRGLSDGRALRPLAPDG